jgi:hypothetical protein
MDTDLRTKTWTRIARMIARNTCVFENLGKREKVPFPLTPALSLGEGETLPASRRIHAALLLTDFRDTKRCQRLFPFHEPERRSPIRRVGNTHGIAPGRRPALDSRIAVCLNLLLDSHIIGLPCAKPTKTSALLRFMGREQVQLEQGTSHEPQSRAGVSPAPRARQRERCVGFADGAGETPALRSPLRCSGSRVQCAIVSGNSLPEGKGQGEGERGGGEPGRRPALR